MDNATIRLIKRTLTLLDAALETPVPTYKKRNKVYLEENAMKVGNALFEAHRTLTAILEDNGVEDQVTPKVDSIAAICSIEGDHDPHILGGSADKYGIMHTYSCPGREKTKDQKYVSGGYRD